MSSIDQLVATIERRIAQVQAEITSLESALTALGNHRGQAVVKGHSSQKRPGRRAAGSQQRTSRSPTQKAPTVVSANKVEGVLQSTEGLSSSELAEKVGGDRRHALAVLRELEAAGRVRRSGVRRGTRWHAITDEDRITARAAELARQSKKRQAPASSRS